MPRSRLRGVAADGYPGAVCRLVPGGAPGGWEGGTRVEGRCGTGSDPGLSHPSPDLSMANETPSPTVDPTASREVAEDVWVLGDRRVPLVPNIGIVLGKQAALVVDTGMGPANGAAVLEAARALAGSRRLLLTLTHFHPEHGYGAQAFAPHATIVYNASQRDELLAKGAGYLALFRGMGETIAAALEGTELVGPEIAYAGGTCTIDLGNRSVLLEDHGPAHTRGDQTVFVPDAGVLFTGDLAEEKTFPIFPWFPPEDADIDAGRWLEVLARCEAMAPRVVVPGHGEVGGVEIVRDVRRYMLDLRRQTGELARQGHDAEAIIAALKPQMIAAHPGWHFPEWIDFAVRTYLAQPGDTAQPKIQRSSS